MNSDVAEVQSSVIRLVQALNSIYEENSIIVHKQESRPVQFFLKELVIADRLLKKALWFLSERLDLQISFTFSQAQTSPSWLKNLSISTLNRAMPTAVCTLNYHFPFYLSANLFHSYSLWLSFVIFWCHCLECCPEFCRPLVTLGFWSPINADLMHFCRHKFYHHRSTCIGKSSSLMCARSYYEDRNQYLKTHSLDNHEQFCLSYILTGHSFHQTLGVAYTGGICASHLSVEDPRTRQVEKRSFNSGFVSIEVGTS